MLPLMTKHNDNGSHLHHYSSVKLPIFAGTVITTHIENDSSQFGLIPRGSNFTQLHLLIKSQEHAVISTTCFNSLWVKL